MGLVDNWHLISDYHLSMQFNSLSRPPYLQSQLCPSHHRYCRPSLYVTSFLSYMSDDDVLLSLTFLPLPQVCFVKCFKSISLSNSVFCCWVHFSLHIVLFHALKVSCFTYWQSQTCTPSFSPLFYTVPCNSLPSPHSLSVYGLFIVNSHHPTGGVPLITHIKPT